MLVIFDMDGTLTESSTLLANSINYVREKIGLEPLQKETIIKEINNPYCDMPKFFYNIDRLESIHEEWFSYYYKNNFEREQELFSGVDIMLDKLKKSNIQLAIATNAYKESAIQTLKHLNIIDYFEEIIAFDDVDEGKPSPKMLLNILDRLGKTSKEALFIGDSQRDEIAAKRANIEFIKVSFGNPDFKLDRVISKIEEYFCIIS